MKASQKHRIGQRKSSKTIPQNMWFSYRITYGLWGMMVGARNTVVGENYLTNTEWILLSVATTISTFEPMLYMPTKKPMVQKEPYTYKHRHRTTQEDDLWTICSTTRTLSRLVGQKGAKPSEP